MQSPSTAAGYPAWKNESLLPIEWLRGIARALSRRWVLSGTRRSSTLGFSSRAKLDVPSGFWQTSYALQEITDETAAEIAELVRRAAS